MVMWLIRRNVKCGSSVAHAQFGFITRAGWTPALKTMMEATTVLIALLKYFNASIPVPVKH